MPVWKSLLMIFASVLIGVFGQLSLKSGMTQVGRVDAQALSHPVQTLVRVFTTPIILAGIALYIVGTLIWLVVLSRMDLSFAYPLVATTYVFTPLLAHLLLNEPIPTLRWLGIAFILVGVFIVAKA
jgi:drug/metabolite transporter (DMT)-like permease